MLWVEPSLQRARCGKRTYAILQAAEMMTVLSKPICNVREHSVTCTGFLQLVLHEEKFISSHIPIRSNYTTERGVTRNHVDCLFINHVVHCSLILQFTRPMHPAWSTCDCVSTLGPSCTLRFQMAAICIFGLLVLLHILCISCSSHLSVVPRWRIPCVCIGRDATAPCDPVSAFPVVQVPSPQPRYLFHSLRVDSHVAWRTNDVAHVLGLERDTSGTTEDRWRLRNMAEPKNEEEVVRKFNLLRQEVQQVRWTWRTKGRERTCSQASWWIALTSTIACLSNRVAIDPSLDEGAVRRIACTRYGRSLTWWHPRLLDVVLRTLLCVM